MSTFRAIVIACLALASVGCADPKKLPEQRIDNVVRVFMHTPQSYTLFVKQPGTDALAVHTFDVATQVRTFREKSFVACGVQFITDVPRGEPMWATVERWDQGIEGFCVCVLVIHLHNSTEVDGGGWNWNHGKFGHGTTQVVE